VDLGRGLDPARAVEAHRTSPAEPTAPFLGAGKRTYIHLMDEGPGDADFLDAAVTVGEGNARATEAPETAANEEPAAVAEIAV
jgi:hypothetical protein